MLLIGWRSASSNPKHYSDLGSDRSSVWNFSARSQTSFRTSTTCGGVPKCQLLSQATENVATKILTPGQKRTSHPLLTFMILDYAHSPEGHAIIRIFSHDLSSNLLRI